MEDKTLELIGAAKDAVAKLSCEHDAQILAAVLLSRAAWVYQQLRMAGIESKETIETCFAYALEQSRQDGERAPVLTNEGVVTSGRKQ